jgi:hypothetical protein
MPTENCEWGQIPGHAGDVDHSAIELQVKYDDLAGNEAWGQHPLWPMESWGEAAAGLDTRLGYWDWVLTQLQCERAESNRLTNVLVA